MNSGIQLIRMSDGHHGIFIHKNCSDIALPEAVSSLTQNRYTLNANFSYFISSLDIDLRKYELIKASNVCWEIKWIVY